MIITLFSAYAETDARLFWQAEAGTFLPASFAFFPDHTDSQLKTLICRIEVFDMRII